MHILSQLPTQFTVQDYVNLSGSSYLHAQNIITMLCAKGEIRSIPDTIYYERVNSQ